MAHFQPSDMVVFISHATSDNERFVEQFNAALVECGFKTIVDFQDFKLGESLISSIFDKGVYAADAIVIVISKHTADRRYPRAELDHAVARNIEESVPLVTIVLDNAEVPPPLRVALQLRLGAHDTPDSAATRVADELREKRAAATAASPLRARWIAASVRGPIQSEPIDEYVLRYVTEETVAKNYEFVDVTSLLSEIERNGTGDCDDLEASLAVLENKGLIQQEHEIGARLPFAIRLTQKGSIQLFRHFMPQLFDEAYSAVVQSTKSAYPGSVDISQLASTLGAPEVVILAIGQELQARGLARLEQYLGSWGDIIGTAAIRRA